MYRASGISRGAWLVVLCVLVGWSIALSAQNKVDSIGYVMQVHGTWSLQSAGISNSLVQWQELPEGCRVVPGRLGRTGYLVPRERRDAGP